MHYKDVIFANKKFSLFANGELYWPGKKTLIISDLHLEKGSFFTESNQYIPPFDTTETLRNLSDFINNHPVEKIIFLGDLIHDKFAFQRMTEKSKELFFKILENIDCTLTVGNHDNISFLEDIGLTLTNEVVIDGICFSHYPSYDQRFSVFGHYHPKVKLIINARGIWVACFVLSKKRILMPSYGYYTGGLSIKDAQIQDLFDAQYEIFPLAKEKIYKLSLKK